MKSLKKDFLIYCSNHKLKINKNQIKIIELLIKFHNNCFKKNFFLNLFRKKFDPQGFYLFGSVGVGKTMILNFFYENLSVPKKRLHFNEFMIKFHDFSYDRKKIDKSNVIDSFVKNIKKDCELIYFDEFQVTNIVDAMILGNLFKVMFRENIKIITTSNTKIDNLYKDGLQREQFIPFINIMKKKSIEKELIIEEDYRKSKSNMMNRFFYPLNEDTYFKINQIFRQLTKEKRASTQTLEIKGRLFEINKYFEGIARFNFNDLCGQNTGAEDYLKIAEVCNFIVIEDIPIFNESTKDKQQRFITLIDILYEKNIPLMTSSMLNLEKFVSSKFLETPFKRTLSRLYELTSIKIDK